MPSTPQDVSVLADHGGEMGGLVTARDWSTTALGPMDAWSIATQTTVRTALASRFPIVLFLGPQLTLIYNDAYIPMLGDKHPDALGRPGARVWWDVWDVVGPMLDGVLATGVATWSDDQVLYMVRNGFREETYFTFSYSPLHDDAGSVTGVFCAVQETSQRVIGERRLRALGELATALRAADDDQAVVTATSDTLSRYENDLAGASLVLSPADGADPIAGQFGPLDWSAELSQRVAMATKTWHDDGAGTMHPPLLVENLNQSQSRILNGPATQVPYQIQVLALTESTEGAIAGWISLGISPFLSLDEEYQSFLALIADQVSSGLARVRSSAKERHRIEVLQQLDRTKSQFFANISHEFRTPLTLMRGPTEDALADVRAVLAPVHRDRLEIIERNCIRLTKLVNSLLDFSQIESGRLTLEFSPVELARTTAELTTIFRSAIENSGIELHIDCVPLTKMAYVDKGAWEKIVLNLVSNAVKYTTSGSIRVQVREQGDWAELIVADTGIGIAPEHQPGIFDRFNRVLGGLARSHEGSGIGLALVAELVAMHEGDVTVDSVLGAGSQFTVRIPLCPDGHEPSHLVDPPAQGPDPSPTSTSPVIAEYLEEIRQFARDDADTGLGPLDRPPPYLPGTGGPARTVTPPEVGRAEDGSHVARSRPLVLVVDDNKDMRDYLAGLLAKTYEVITAPDGRWALDLVRRAVPDLVLSDVMMPHLDGVGLIQALRSDPATRDLPVLMLSALAGESDSVEGLGMGANDYIVKPFSSRELLARVQSHLDLHRVRLDRDQYQNLLQDFPTMVWHANATATCDYFNKAWLNFTGRTLADSTGQGWINDIHPDDREECVRRYLSAFAQHETFEMEYRLIHHTGEARWIIDIGCPCYGPLGQFEGYIGMCLDNTERRQNLEALAFAQGLAQLGSWQVDAASGMITASPELLSMLKVPSGGHLILGDYRAAGAFFRDGEDFYRFRQIVDAALVGEVTVDHEMHLVDLDGEVHVVRVRGAVVRDDSGNPLHLRGTIQDITEQRQAEEALRAAAQAEQEGAWQSQVAAALQASLSPLRVYHSDDLSMAGFYRAGVAGTEVGGDWYDVIELDSGRSAVVVGDVMGRGISAATVMGQLRSTVRAYARLDLSPAQTIKLLDRVVRDIGEDEIVTCVFGIYDPAQRSLTYANAGHPPPLLVGADGRVTRLSGPTGPPLGSGAPSTSEDNIELPDASMLALYTDGLVERRGQDIDDGIDMLARALALVPGSFIELPENIVTTLRPPGQDDDDIALLLVRPIPSDP